MDKRSSRRKDIWSGGKASGKLGKVVQDKNGMREERLHHRVLKVRFAGENADVDR